MKDHKNQSDAGHVVEDVTGFNFRSLRTIRDLVIRPGQVFRAYVAQDRDTYTPALRLWLGVIGLQVLVSSIWGGWAGVIRRQIEIGGPATMEAYNQISGGRLDAFIDHYGDAMGFSQPIIVGGFSALSIFVMGWFRKGLLWPSRLNIAMGVLTVGSVLGLLLMPLIFIEQFSPWMWSATVAINVAYFITFLRGAPGVLADTALGAWTKALVYTLTLGVLIVLAAIVVAAGATGYAMLRLDAG